MLGPLIALDTLERHIATVVLDRLEVTWDERYGRLVAFKQQHGHCNVPAKYPDNPVLGIWLDTVRRAKKRGTLSADRTARLDALDFIWDVLDATWEEQYQKLVAFKQRYGHAIVPWSYHPMAKWLQKQQEKKRRGGLSADRIARLDALGVVWGPTNRK